MISIKISLILLCILFLSACVNSNTTIEVTPTNSPSQISSSMEDESIFDSKYSNDLDKSELNFSTKYEGTWVNEATCEVGCSITLTLKFLSENKAVISILQESFNANHLADIEETVTFDSNGLAYFSFENDGWMNSGEGSILLKLDSVEVNIFNVLSNEEEGISLYQIFEGKEEFYKQITS